MFLSRLWKSALWFAAGLTLSLGAKAAEPVDLTREIALTPHEGAAREDAEIKRWQERAAARDAKPEVWERLGWAYVAKARRTQDAGFLKLAEKACDVREAQFGGSAESQLLRGHIWHNLHRFAAAEELARKLVAERGAPAELALLSDALMEQGKLREAISTLQRLVEIKPGVEAYSRIAHVRWLKGDVAGAIAMLDAAWSAAANADAETRAWLLTRLANLRLHEGALAQALALADNANEIATDYTPALLARGKALLALTQTGDAVRVLERAAQLVSLPEYRWWLAEALRAAGQLERATEAEALIRTQGGLADARNTALFLATRGENLAAAERLARADLAERADVFSYDTLAWTLTAQGKLAEAHEAMQAALRESTRDARLLWHAGEIAWQRDERDAAAVHFRAARGGAATLLPSERSALERRLTEIGRTAAQ